MPSRIAPADDAVLLVQLSDSHLFAAADGRLLGMDTRDSLQRVIERVLEEQGQVDLMLATGDISQDGSVQSYRRFLQMTSQLPGQQRWLAGNHDDLEAMREVCAGTQLLAPVIDLGGWRVILLDSSVVGSVAGQLAAEQLALLEQALLEAGGRPVLVSLHHHPVSVGCEWLEPIGLRNPEALFAVLERYPQVRALVWGHVHQELDHYRGTVRLLASLSTCVQFAPGSKEFQVDHEAPGYRWLRLHADGRLETGVSRVTDIDFEIDYSIKGY